MKRNFWPKQLPFALALAIGITAIAWQTQPGKPKPASTDTLPDRHKKIRDIDDVLDELERSKADVDRSLKDIDWQKIDQEIKTSIKNVHIDADKIKANLDMAMKEVDIAKIQADVQRSLKDVDAAKIQADVESSLKDIDMAKVQEEVKNAIKAIDMNKIKADIDASISKIDWEKMKAEIDKVKDMNFDKIEKDIKDIKPDIEKSMNDAHASIDKARKELTAYKNLIDGLDKDGLINKKGTYTIEYKNGDLLIDGKKQPAEVVTKYSNFLKGHKDFTLKKSDDNFTIDND